MTEKERRESMMEWCLGHYPWDIAPCGACVIMHKPGLFNGFCHCQDPNKHAALRKDLDRFKGLGIGQIVYNHREEILALREKYADMWVRHPKHPQEEREEMVLEAIGAEADWS